MALGVPGPEALAVAVIAHVLTVVPLAVGGAVSVSVIGTRLGRLSLEARRPLASLATMRPSGADGARPQ